MRARCVGIFVLVCLSAALACGGQRAPTPTGAILISIDTLRADHLGCYGYGRPTSPAIDRLASEGVVFEDASTTSPWTLPSHASLVTGLYPSRHGVRGVGAALPSATPTLAEVLARAGFRTGAIVNSTYLGRAYGFARGFEDFRRIPENVTERGAAEEIVGSAIDWLENHGKNRFFLFLHIYDVHSDYRSLPPYQEALVDPYDGPADGTTAQLLAFRRGDVSFGAPDARHLAQLYDAGIRQLDDRLRRLFEYLASSGLERSTIVVLTSDHGEEFLEHGGVLHGRTQYQELIHIPLVLRGPGLPRGRRIHEMVSLVDVMSTLLGLLGIDTPVETNGVDLRGLWQREARQLPERLIFSEADHNNVAPDIKRAVRDERYKLHHDRLTGEVQLYDLAEDPAERKDLARAVPEKTRALLEALHAFMAGDVKAQPGMPLTEEQRRMLESLGYLH